MDSNIQLLEIAKRVINQEADALRNLQDNIPNDFALLVNHIVYELKGKVILTGIGKSGYIAHKIASSLASTGTKSIYIHPSEASHGDLGMIAKEDIIIMLSNSGETKELFDIINYAKKFNIKIAGITMNSSSTLASNSDFLLLLPQESEASMIMAPTTSSIMMLSIGDSLAVALQEIKNFSKDDFAIFHPGGKLGIILSNDN